MKLLTIVCCIGNRQIFDLRLGESLKRVGGQYDLITPPLTLTVPQAYNSIDCEKITTKYIMFIHEDVRIQQEENWIQRTIAYLDKIPNLGVAGVAGLRVGGGFDNAVGWVDHWGSRGMPRARGWGHPKWDGQIVPVQTLDAQLLIVPTEIFKKYKFNEEFPFHMMAEDYCLTLLYDYNLGVYVIPLPVWHNEAGLSRGKMHGNLAKAHQQLYNKWYERLKNIGIYVTSFAYGLKPQTGHYCPQCGGDVDTLTTHVANPEYNFECRVCHYKFGKR